MSVLSIIIGLVVGGGGTFVLQQWIAGNRIKQKIAEAETEAERIKKERMLQAK